MTSRVPLERTALLVNGGSRTGARGYQPAQRALRARGVRLLVCRSITDPNAMGDAVQAAVRDGCGLVVIGGGDGTIGGVAGVLARLPRQESVVLGVLPLGTANDFVRTLEIPFNVEKACDVIVDGKIVDIDLGWANDRPFVNAASLGLSVGSAKALKAPMKKALGPAAYPLSVALAYRKHHPFRMRLDFPDGDLDPVQLDDLLQVAIGNGRHYGGGQTLSPNASLDDHKLDVYAIKTGRVRDHLSLRRLLKDGTIIEHDDVHHLVTKQLRLETDSPQAVNLDGEIVTESPVDFTIQRNAIEVVVPQHVTHLRHDSEDQRPGRATNESTRPS